MNLQRLDCSKMYVRHPRFGGTPLRSKDASAQVAARKHFRGNYPGPVPAEVQTGHELFYPDSAIRVRMIPPKNGEGSFSTLCMDHGKRCKTCSRWFLFWALEQRYWHEELKLHSMVLCTECWECRRKRQEIQRLSKEYADLLSNGDKSIGEWDRLSALGDRLFEVGYIKKRETLANSRIPKRLRRSIGK